MESRPFNDDLDRHEVNRHERRGGLLQQRYGEGTHLPKDGDIYASFINCRQRTNSDGVYIPAPIDEEWMLLREGRQYAELELNWIESFSQRIKLVCPANITSKDFN